MKIKIVNNIILCFKGQINVKILVLIQEEKKNLESRWLTTNNVAKDTIVIIIRSSWTERSGEWIRRSETGRVEMGGQNGNSPPRCFFNGHLCRFEIRNHASPCLKKKQRPLHALVCFFVMCALNKGGCIYSILSTFAACVAFMNKWEGFKWV